MHLFSRIEFRRQRLHLFRLAANIRRDVTQIAHHPHRRPDHSYWFAPSVTRFAYFSVTMADKDPNEKTIEEDLVVTKYKMAGELVNRK